MMLNVRIKYFPFIELIRYRNSGPYSWNYINQDLATLKLNMVEPA